MELREAGASWLSLKVETYGDGVGSVKCSPSCWN
jgi:hypothetical protein